MNAVDEYEKTRLWLDHEQAEMEREEASEAAEHEMCPFCGNDLPDPELCEEQEFEGDGNEVCPGCGEVV